MDVTTYVCDFWTFPTEDPSIDFFPFYIFWKHTPFPFIWCCNSCWKPKSNLRTLLVRCALHMGGKRLIYVAFWESYYHGWKVLSLANSRCIRHHMKRFHSKGQMPKNGHLGSLSRRSDSGFECLIRHNVCIQLKVSWPWDWAPKGRPCKNSNVYYFFCLSDSSKNSV